MSRSKGNPVIPVKDVMTSPVVTVIEDENVEHVAKLIVERDIGSIVVIDHQGNPLGVITERDITIRVAAKNLLPRKVKAKETMSSPLRTIAPEADITEAANKMKEYGVRRLIVMTKGKMAGIVSSSDIVSITPALIEIITERARAAQRLPLITEDSSSNYCDRCRQWSDTLVNVEGRFVCEECRMEFESE